MIWRANRRTAAATAAASVVAVAFALVACGPQRSYDNPPEIPIGTLSTTTTTSTTTTVFVPTTAPTTLPPSTTSPPPTAPPTFPPQTAPPTQPTVPVATTGDVYTVVRGDTLFGIANKLGVDINSLLSANGLQENSLIIPGQRLGVPQGGALPATTQAPPPPPPRTNPPAPPPTPAPTTQPPPPTTGDRYTVVQGDTLFAIARKLGVPLGQLLTANRLNANSVIQPGQQLVIPQGATAPAPPATPSPPSPQPPAPPQPPEPGRPTTTTLPPAPNGIVPRQTAASCQAPDSEEADGTPIVFAPSNVFDRNPATAWRCDAATPDISLTFELDGPTRLGSVGLIGGYVKVDPLTEVDRFPQNRRVRQVRWTFDGGATVTQDLADSRELQTIAVDVTTARVTMTVTATYPAGGELPRDFVPVAEVQLLGG